MKRIKNFQNLRGFYCKKDSTGEAYYDEGMCPKGFTIKYARGYELGFGDSVVSHLFYKLQAKAPLSEYELEDFYEKVPLNNPFIQNWGRWYDFRTVLKKVPYVGFWYIEGVLPPMKLLDGDGTVLIQLDSMILDDMKSHNL